MTRARERTWKWKDAEAMERGCVDDGEEEEVPPHGQRTGGGGQGGKREAERESRAGGRQRVRMYRAKAGGIGMLRESAERCFSRAAALVPASRYS